VRFLERPLDRSALAGLVACGLLVACNGSPDEEGGLAPPVEDAEGIDTSAAVEPEPSESEPDDATEESDGTEPIGDDEPLYAPLPELTPDPDNDIPDELELAFLEAAAEAIANEFRMFADAEIDEDLLALRHAREAEELVRSSVDQLQEMGAVERSADAKVLRLFVRESAAGGAVVRECLQPGEGSGIYDAESGQLVEQSPQNIMARDRFVEYVERPGDKAPTPRVLRIDFVDAEGCTQ